MIPCYKEDIETLEETVECAVEAAKAAMAKGQTNAGEFVLSMLAFQVLRRLSQLSVSVRLFPVEAAKARVS